MCEDNFTLSMRYITILAKHAENMENRRVKHVVVDAIAFFKNVQLQVILVNKRNDGDYTRYSLAFLSSTV